MARTPVVAPPTVAPAFAWFTRRTTILRCTVLSAIWRVPILPLCIVRRRNVAAIKLGRYCQWLADAARWPAFGHTFWAATAFWHDSGLL
jgi:hypothetical protein